MKRLLFLALAGAALLASIRPAAAQAPNAGVSLILSSRPLLKAPVTDGERSNVLRPIVEQELFTYVLNTAQQAQTVKVQLLADGVEVISSKDQSIGPGKFVPIFWPRAAETPGAKPAELARPVVFRLLDAKGDKLGEDKKLIVDRPDNYLDAELEFIPRRGAEANRLIVTMTPKDNFKGPPCRVQLALDPERIPGLVPGQKKKGVYAGYVTAEKNDKDRFKSLNLIAEDIRLSSDERQRSGVVRIEADGYNRAFTFPTDFPLAGTSSKPQKRGNETLRLNSLPFADPGTPTPVVIEADNLVNREDARLVLEVAPLLTDKKKAAADQFSLVAEFRGERDVQLVFRGGGKDGGLRFVPQVRDWSKSLDLGGLYGSVMLRLRLLDKDGKEREVLDGETGDKTTEVLKTITLDDTPPAVRFEKLPRPAVRTKPFVVEARGIDDESGIRDVVFFLGKIAANAPVPPDAIARPGKQSKKDVWGAELVVPSDARSPQNLSVRFTNNAGLSTTEVIPLEVTDPPPPGVKVARKGSIAGVVMEGERPQKELKVDLLDPAGKVLLSTNTADDGSYVFRDLLPGDYRVASVKTVSNTAGMTPRAGQPALALGEGEEKLGVVIKLWRRPNRVR
jgi:hypothetical protein